MRAVFGVLAFLGVATGAWAAGTEPPRVGPLVVGMPVDAAKAALPPASWTDIVSPYTGKVTGIKAGAVWTLDEQRYDAALRPLRYGAAEMTLRSRAEVRSARVCRARVLSLAKYFEQFFDALRPMGGVPFKTLTAGRAAQVGEVEEEGDDDFFGTDSMYGWFFSQAPSEAYPFGVSANAQFLPGDRTCAIAADIKLPAKNRPAFEVLDTQAVKPTRQPTASVPSFSIEGLSLPKGGTTVSLNCEVVRTAGYLQDCFEGARGKPLTPEGRAARERANGIAFDPKQLDPDNDVPLRAVLTMKLLPSEQKTPAELGVSHPAPMSGNPRPTVNHRWAKVATGDELMTRYPMKALREGIQGSITATCTVRADMSLSCTDIIGDPPGVFEGAAKSVLALYRVEPTLKDGTRAEGAVLKLRVKFVIPE